MHFVLEQENGGARAGLLRTDRGEIPTPMFMPVGTQGTVKAVEQRELEEMGAAVILGNTYHLYLRPGPALVEKAGGLHRFINWNRPILTDSGGFQVFSLSDLRLISEEGVQFKSHHDGSLHQFTPENVCDIQRSLGSDVMMVLDECSPFPCDEEDARTSNERTVRWAARARERFEQTKPLYGCGQMQFAIVQGSVFPTIRRRSAEQLSVMGFDGYAIGGLSVGEPAARMYEITEVCTGVLPREKPRYLMGVGTPENIVESIGRGVDLFDCVLPTRNGRNANLFTRRGRLNIRNAAYAADFSPVDNGCSCYCCRNFTRAYLRHLFRCGEILGLQLATLHNLHFYLWLVAEARTTILEERFEEWKRTMLADFARPAPESSSHIG